MYIGECELDPLTYKVTIYEMGLCTANPMSPMSDNKFDASNCTKTFEKANGVTNDLAVPTDIPLDGINYQPVVGTYKYPYVILGNAFTLQNTVTFGNTTYYSTSEGGASTTEGSASTTEGGEAPAEGEATTTE